MTYLGGRGEPAASLVTEHGQPVHDQCVADEVDLLAEAAEAVSSPEEQCVLEVPVDGFGVVPARVKAGEVGIRGRDGPDVLGSVEAPGPILVVRMEPNRDGAATHPIWQSVVVVPAVILLLSRVLWVRIRRSGSKTI